MGRAAAGVLAATVLAAGTVLCQQAPRDALTVTVSADKPVGEIYRFWSVGNFTRSSDLLTPGAIEQYRLQVPFVTELNLVYLLGGRYEDENVWFLGLDPDGKVKADFTGMVAQLKACLAAGYTPRIVLDNVPYAMSNPPRESFYGNTAPPGDERVWREYVRLAVQAMVKEFGRETVAGWWFRVGTEPDLSPGHWAGTREEYFAHYDYTVDGLAQALPEAGVGPGNILRPSSAPSRRGRRWGLDIIDHAAAETNLAAGGMGARMDIFSCSWYTGVGASAGGLDDTVRVIRERLDRYPRFRGLPVEAGEYAVLSDGARRRLYAGETTEWSASFQAALAARVYALGVRKMYEWDEATMGVPHPRGLVLGMLEKMAGGTLLDATCAETSMVDTGAIACRKDDDLYVLVFSHRPERKAEGNEVLRLAVRDPRMLPGARWRITEETVDREHGVWAYAFEADATTAGLAPLPNAGLYEGSPSRLYGERGPEVFRKNIEKYRQMAVPAKTRDELVPVREGVLELALDMPPHSVRLLRLSPR